MLVFRKKDAVKNAGFPVWFFAGIIVFALIKLWLIKGQTLIAFGPAAHDDRLFLSLAENIINGNWLGNYNNLTLAKGCFYPIWIALVFILNIPLLLAQHLLYSFSVLVLIFALRPLINKPTILLLLFGALLFNPVTYDQTTLRVLREGIYPSLSLLVIATLIGVLGSFRSKNKIFVAWLLCLGILLSAFWLTREEGIWIMPMVGLVLLWTAIKLWRSNISDRLCRCVLLLTPFIVLSGAILAISAINLNAYGSFTTVEFKNHDFLDAYGALTRVKAEKVIDRVPVTKETRMRIYPLSPAFAELKPFLEGEGGKAWAEVSRQVYPELKGEEIAGGWFMWALRDAVAAAGHCTSAKEAMAFYRRLADEINSACDDGALDSYSKRSSMMPVWQTEFNRPLLKTMANAAMFLATFKDINSNSTNSQGSDVLLSLFRDLTRERLSPLSTDTKIRLSGWVFGVEEQLNYSVKKVDGSLVDATIRWSSSPDVYNYFLEQQRNLPNAKESRFEIIVIGEKDIYLEIRNNDLIVKKIPLDGTVKFTEDSNLCFCLDDMVDYSILPQQARIDRIKVKVLCKIGKMYQIALPYFMVLSIVALISGAYYSWVKQKTVSDIIIIEIGLFAVLMSRIFILSIIHITAFPGVNINYLSPAYPVLILFVLLPICENSLSKFVCFKVKNNRLSSALRKKYSKCISKNSGIN
jgi:hypothetical protein